MLGADFTGFIVAGLILLVGLLSVFRLNSGRRKKRLGNRIHELTHFKEEKSIEDTSELFRALEEERPKGLSGYIKHWVDETLRPVGGFAQVRPILLMSAVAGLLCAFIGERFLGLPKLFTLVFALTFALIVPLWYLKGQGIRRRDKFLDAFPDAIDLVVRAIRAGIPTSESIASAGRELPDPLGSEFRRISQEITIGMPPDAALQQAAARVRINDFNFFAVTLVLQRETGGNLAETLENLSTLLRKRREMRLKVKALTAEGRFTSKVIAGLPIVVMIALYFLNRDYVVLLFTDSVGQLFLGIATAFVIVGSLVLNRMVNLEV